MTERLQKILSRAGVASRRAAERLMVDGRVTVNGQTIRELGSRADAAADDIRVDGRRVRISERRRYLLLNKPPGYVTTRSDPQQRPTILHLLTGVREYVYPVGRLDFESEGLLILTNDGDLAAGLTHPRHGVPRVYEARVLGTPDAHDLDRLTRGVVIDGQRTRPADVKVLRRPVHAPGAGHRPHVRPEVRPSEVLLLITIHEGRNRQVRNMCEAIGHPVTRLKRVAIGPIRDSKLKPGQWRDLTADEVERLRWAVSAPIPARSSRTPAPPAR
jgi:23S rRNA pseudouridine2605 synthase